MPEHVYSVLILDDNSMVVKPLERILRGKGFIVWGTMDPEEAIRAVEGHKPSVALIDLEMPKMNGIQVIKKMKELVPDIRIIVVTGHLADYRTDVEELKLRVVEKSSRTFREVEAVVIEELELSRKDVAALQTKKKPKTSLRILFVDDEIEQADFFCEIVTTMGVEAESAESYEVALDKAKILRPNVICADLKMQSVDGDELIRKMKGSGDHKFVKLYVGITGFSEAKDRFFEAGAKEVLIKPVNLTEFTESLKRWEKLVAT